MGLAVNTGNLGLSEEEYTEILQEIEEQPDWRHTADKEMAYADGNQLDSELLQKQRELGIPPAIEDLISPTLLAIQGYASTVRTDWRVTPDGDIGGQEVADALNYKLNQAERQSRADRACSRAFRSQIGCGLGWVEVSRNPDPFKYPYRCTAIHRNEIFWDMQAQEDDLSDARWLLRRRWIAAERLALVFPDHAEMINMMGKHGEGWHDYMTLDGGASTGLGNAWGVSGNRTLLESRWYNPVNKELCVSELWYRRWVSVLVIKTPNGRVVEYDADNPRHAMLVASGAIQVKPAIVARVRRAFWIGRVCLMDAETPYPHSHFPYVRFMGFTEDETGVPYGYVRGMKYAQDSLNSGNSKLRWGMSVVRIERTKGAVLMTDAQLRRQVSRPDADIVLDPNTMSQPGARFEIKRDYELSQQHYQMLQDNRQSIQRISGVTDSFMGRQGTATSGLQEQTQVEQGNQALGRMMDNFRDARSLVGELLLALIIEDLGREPQTIIIEGDAVTADRVVKINAPETDPDTGMVYLSNDLQATRLKVALEDVPSTNSYRGQQLAAMSEAVKSLPPEYKAVMLPFMVSLMDMPHKDKVVEAIRQVQQTPTPEEIQQRIDQAVKDALAKAGNDIKQAELALKERLADSEIKERDARAVQIGVQAAYAAMQSGVQIAQMPQIAPLADSVMQSAGYQRPNPQGHDPNYPIPQGVNVPEQGVQQNTSPAYPPVPQQPDGAMGGIETMQMGDDG